MVLALVLVLVALALLGVGLAVEGLKWLLIIALALFVCALVAGAVKRRQL